MAACHIWLVEGIAVQKAVKFFFFLIVESTENLYVVFVLEVYVKYFGAKHNFKTHTSFCFLWKRRRILNMWVLLQG